MSQRSFPRRGFLSIGGGAALGLILAACGSQATPTVAPTAKPAEQKPAEQKPAEQKPAAEAKPTTAPAASAPPNADATTVVVWAGGLASEDEAANASQTQWARWVKSTFQEKNPKYVVKAEDHGWDQPLRTGLLTAIAGGTPPEITTGEAFVHEFASLGAFVAVPDLAIQHFAYGPVAGSIFKGQLYGVPIATSPFALETNKRTAEKAGLDPNTPPKTWDELVANSVKAHTAGAGNFVGFNLYGPAPNRIYGTVLRTIPWINQTGKPLGDDEGTEGYFNAPEHVAAYELSRKLFATADPGNTFSGDEGKLYAYVWEDKAVYQVSATWNIFNAKDANADSVFHPLPRQDVNRSGNVVLGNEVYSVLAKAKNRDGAVEFVKFMAEAETQQQLGRLLGSRLPTVADVLKNPELEKLPGYAPVSSSIRVFADILLTEDVRPVPPYAKNPDKIWIAWGDAFGKILQSQDDIQSILDAVQADVQKLLA